MSIRKPLRVQQLGDVHLDFHGLTILAPGQPLQLSWSASTLISYMSDVVATISYKNIVLYTSKSISCAKNTNWGGFNGGETDVVITLTTQHQAAQQGLYTSGMKTLTLSVVVDNDNKKIHTTSIDVAVGLEIIDSSWWNFTSPSNGALAVIPWNTTYGILGNFINKSPYNVMKVQCQLTEVGVTDNTPLNPIGTQSFTANIGSTPTPVQFSSIIQKWAWVLTPSGLLVAPTTKNFDYTITMDLQDPWGNTYNLFSNTLTVSIFVPQYKLDDATGAEISMGIALAGIVGGGISGIFSFGIGAAIGAGVAAAAAISAAAFAGSAQDPPSPDFGFHVPVKVTMPKLIELPKDATSYLLSTRTHLTSIIQIMTISDALSQTEGKLIAARMDANADGINLQITTYKDLESQMMNLVKQFPQTLQDVIKELTKEPIPTIYDIRSTLHIWQIHGIPSSVDEGLSGLKIPLNIISALKEAIMSAVPETLPSLVDSITRLTSLASAHVKNIDQKMNSILNSQ